MWYEYDRYWDRQVGVSLSRRKTAVISAKAVLPLEKLWRLFFFILLGAALVIVLTQPIFRIYGDTMSPNLKDGDIVVALKDDTPEPGGCGCDRLQQQKFSCAA